MITRIALCALTAFAVLSAAPASAHGYRDNDHGFRPRYHRHFHRPLRPVAYPQIVHVPAATYYYAPPQVVYYPQPLYHNPVNSFTWFFR